MEGLFSTDFGYILKWWLVWLFISIPCLTFLPLLFKSFFDKGYIFSKTVALIIISYIVYIIGYFKILPFGRSTIVLVWAGLLFTSLKYLLPKFGGIDEIIKIFKKNWKVFLIEEIIFLAILTFWAWIRGFEPEINSLEKFMDWGFVNSVTRSKYFPPVDMWFSGEPINYYYFGHLMFGMMTVLSGIHSAITYNLSIAVLCALVFVSSASIGINLLYLKKGQLKKIYIFTALVGAFLLTFGGNLHTVYKIGANIIKNEGRLIVNKQTIETAAKTYWYPDATRFIGYDPDTKDKTIHEFPLYSFVVADLHGHLNNIPVVLLILAVLIILIKQAVIKKGINIFLVLSLGFILSVAYMTNAWDFAVYGLLFALVYFLSHLYQNRDLFSAIKDSFINGILIIVCWFVFSLPFSAQFEPMVQKGCEAPSKNFIGPLCTVDSRSPIWQLFVLYGGFMIITIPFLFFVGYWVLKKKFRKIDLSDVFVSALILNAIIFIIVPELVYIKDIYIYEHRRSNTMFKLVYQSFMLLSLASGYSLVTIKNIKNVVLSFVYQVIFALIFTCHMIYPYFAIKSNYGELKDYKGIYGEHFLSDNYPDNYQMIVWMRKNLKDQPIVLEAVGDSYTEFNQVSAATGFPTVEGWIVHEWLWRGGYDRPAERQADVEKIYISDSVENLRELVQKYSIDYIFVGSKEREVYTDIDETNFKLAGYQVVAQYGQTKLFKVLK